MSVGAQGHLATLTDLELDWIRTVSNFFGLDSDCKPLQNLRITAGFGPS